MSKQFQEAKSALAFSQSLRDRLSQPEESIEESEEPAMEEPMQESMEAGPIEEKLEIIDKKLDTLLEEPKKDIEPEEVVEKPEEIV